MATLGATLCLTGVRRTDGEDTVTMCWVVESSLGGAFPEAVAYIVSVDGRAILGGAVTERSIAQPDFSDVDSPLPGVASGMAPVECYSLTLTAGALPPGTVYVEATAQGRDGSLLPLETIAWINDSDGADRRPSNKVVYMDTALGSDAANGAGWATAVQTLHRAIELARTGTSCGGATIYVRGAIVGGGGATAPGAWDTGALHWLTIIADSGATWTRVNPPVFTPHWTGNPNDSVQCPGVGSGSYTRVRLQGFAFIGCGPVFYDTGDNTNTIEVWVEGGTWESQFWDDNGARVRCVEDQAELVDVQGATGKKGRYYVTGLIRSGCGIAFRATDMVFDCVAQGMLGGATYCSGWPLTKNVFHSIACRDRSYSRNVTRGWGANNLQGFDARQALEAVDLGGGNWRVLGPNGGYAFGVALNDNVGSTRILCRLANWPGMNGDHIILGGGTTGGRPY
ncbi:MAG: hypothetical protein VKL39_14090, partial [Leptolyngbyaceae bacterium]|nr:hypothetical protein [Leptolyngbyaceae bacterium]